MGIPVTLTTTTDVAPVTFDILPTGIPETYILQYTANTNDGTSLLVAAISSVNYYPLGSVSLLPANVGRSLNHTVSLSGLDLSLCERLDIVDVIVLDSGNEELQITALFIPANPITTPMPPHLAVASATIKPTSVCSATVSGDLDFDNLAVGDTLFQRP